MSQTEAPLEFICHGMHRIAVLSGNPHLTGIPLVFLHGIAGSVHFWPPLLPPRVRDHCRWYSIGLPGHAPGGYLQADSSTDTSSAESVAEVLATVIGRVSPGQPVALIGYSTGGFAALNLAARYPELAASVVSVSGFAVGKWHGSLGRIQQLASHGSVGRRVCALLWSLMSSNPSVFRSLLSLNATRINSPSPRTESLLDGVARDAKQQDPKVLASLIADIRRFDIRPLLDRIYVPVLIAGGDRDPIIRYEHTCELASAIRSAELVRFRDAGHLFFAECLDVFQEVLEVWVDRHCRSPEVQQAA